MALTDRALRVLLIEDSEDDALLLLEELRAGGYTVSWERVETADTMRVALDNADWDAIISDYNLPQFTGLEALEIVTEQGLDVPFIIVSGTIGEDVAVAAMRAGAHDYIMKDRLARLVPAVARELREAEERRVRREAENALQQNRELLARIVETNADGIVIVDLDRRFTFVNSTAEKMLGRSRADILGRTNEELGWKLLKLDGRPLPAADYPSQQAIRSGQAIYGVEFVLERPDGHRLILSQNAAPLTDAKGQLVGTVNSMTDITARKEAEEALIYQALHDTLTDLPNRTLFQDRLHQAVRRTRRDRSALAVLLLDLDRFKEINDTFGHHYGDLLLQQVGKRLSDTVRESDTVARFGGDEFALLLPATDEPGAAQVAENVLSELRPHYVIEGQQLAIEASIGIALCPEHGGDSQTLLRQADVAMYVAKGSNLGYALYSPEQDANSEDRLRLISELREAIEQNRLILHYQPQMHLRTGRLSQVEALVRWQHRERGFIPPDQFIPLAEHTGLIEPLTELVLREAVRQCRAWLDEGLEMRIAVNISAHNLRNGNLPVLVGAELAAKNVKPSALHLELTESAVMENREHVLQILTQLDEMGVQVSIDDFGTGYSSLGYLKRLPAHEIKIDRTFVKDMLLDESNFSIVRTIVDLSHTLGLEVVAEGVETREVIETLRELGCDMAQGYYLSRPLPASEIKAWLENQAFGSSLAS